MSLHKLLLRQLRRYGGDPAADPAAWQAFLQAVSAAYEQADADRILLERAMELTSQELLERNEQLRQELEERKVLEEHLAHQAFHDPLTQLPNRALFRDRLEHALAREGRRPATLAVLMLDLDRFQRINDSLGHEAGDQVLQAVGQRLTGCIRREDTIARFGGDEFAILLEDLSSVREATACAERIGAALQAPVALGSRAVILSVSIGIALGGHEPADAGALLRDADSALYRAKGKGHARFEIFDASMHAYAVERLELEHELRQGLERSEFVVQYQPKIVLTSGAVAGLEALVRWRHPQRGWIAPGAFIPLAEETGLIGPLGRGVLAAACRQARHWLGSSPGANLVMSVNLSACELQQPDLIAGIRRTLDETGVEPGGVQLEITESVLMDDAESNLATLRALKALGVRLAIDDFGTGYSSLSYLQRFPVDELKIDRTFVRELESRAENRAIVQAVIQLGAALKLDVVAEGVETVGEVRQLQALGCPLGQGYYFAPPLPAEAVAGILASRGCVRGPGGGIPPGRNGRRARRRNQTDNGGIRPPQRRALSEKPPGARPGSSAPGPAH